MCHHSLIPIEFYYYDLALPQESFAFIVIVRALLIVHNLNLMVFQNRIPRCYFLGKNNIIYEGKLKAKFLLDLWRMTIFISHNS